MFRICKHSVLALHSLVSGRKYITDLYAVSIVHCWRSVCIVLYSLQSIGFSCHDRTMKKCIHTTISAVRMGGRDLFKAHLKQLFTERTAKENSYCSMNLVRSTIASVFPSVSWAETLIIVHDHRIANLDDCKLAPGNWVDWRGGIGEQYALTGWPCIRWSLILKYLRTE